MPNERYIPHLKFHVSGFSSSPFGIEWMRFDNDSPFDKLILTVPHTAFEVTDLDYEIATRNLKVITESNYCTTFFYYLFKPIISPQESLILYIKTLSF